MVATRSARKRARSPKPRSNAGFDRLLGKITGGAAKKKSPKKKASPKRSKSPARASKSNGGGRKPAAAPAPAAAAAHEGYEFGGPIGAVGTMVMLPVVVYALYFLCGADYCVDASNWRGAWARLPTTEGALAALWSWDALWVVLAWIGFQLALAKLLPGETVDGVVLRDGSRLKYTLNGHLAFWVSLLVVAHGWPAFDAETGAFAGFGPAPLAWCYDNYVQLATAAVAVSTGLSLFVYAYSFRPSGPLLALGGQSGCPPYDFFIGRELNPRVFGFDLKFLMELRPGLIGWAVLDLAMLAHNPSSLPLAMVCCFQGLYVWDALFQERAILTTMDITTDGFGFMLAFGDLAWVPFTYSLQARYLADRDPALGGVALCAICALNFVGYAVFRGANSQKDAFRRDPGAFPRGAWMDTARGRKLLVTGWWGLARKINYSGDWLMGLAWCLCTGFDHVIPYFYAIYFAVLLIHRARRDELACRAKYGDDWARYKRKVPSVFIPGVL